MDQNGEKRAVSATTEILKKRRGGAFTIALILISAIFIVTLPFVAKLAANKYTDRRLAETLSAFREPCAANYGKSDYDIWTGTLLVTDVSVSCDGRNVASFDEVKVFRIVPGRPFPSNMNAEFTGGFVNADSEVFGHAAEFASMLGLSRIPVSGDFIVSYGAANKEFILEKFTAVMPGLGTLEASLSVPGVYGPDPIGTARQIWENNAYRLWASFTDGGLTEKVVSGYASAIESDGLTAKARALHGIERRISNKFKNDQSARERLSQIYRFLENPGTITIKTDGSKAVSLKDAADALQFSGWKSLANSLKNFPLEIRSN